MRQQYRVGAHVMTLVPGKEDYTIQAAARSRRRPKRLGVAYDLLDGRQDGRLRLNATGAGATVYVVDSGCAQSGVATRVTFLDLASTPLDTTGHGTEVLGMILRTAPWATIVCVQTMTRYGGLVSTLVRAVAWIVKDCATHKRCGRSVVNFSAAVPQGDDVVDALARSLVVDHHLKFVASAGNDGGDACAVSPARVPEVTTVTAISTRFLIPPWANVGACVKLASFGVDLPLSDRARSRLVSGTSFSTALVSGIVAQSIQLSAPSVPICNSNPFPFGSVCVF